MYMKCIYSKKKKRRRFIILSASRHLGVMYGSTLNVHRDALIYVKVMNEFSRFFFVFFNKLPPPKPDFVCGQ